MLCNDERLFSTEECKVKLGDIYINKENKSIIQIDSFATHMARPGRDVVIVVFRQIEKHNQFEIGSCPSFNGYGLKEENESEYELLVPQEKLSEYSNWNEIFEFAKCS